ncbi:hypothetical protein HCA64_06495 [Listeria booriae]|uniref:Imm33-like domain-containing protein n=2 Tax=Listeria booriae TaxID=1552123 RepID=A0A099WF36_9LIST|nr:hypothetical protein [Listeria booriae]KGL42725.1 hypothetical protein EP57_04515 [Listeria booriae]MBC1906117.1 hypothetical protein [Listeria booriae]STY40964.1 Uncharacterised protein [Listeria booriae]
MKQFKRSINGKSVAVKAEAKLKPQVDLLYKFLSNIETSNIIDGYSIQIGWAVYFIRGAGDSFQLTVPNFSTNPFEDETTDLTVALWIQLQQSHFLRKVNVDGETIKFSDKVVVAKNILQKSDIYLQRSDGQEKGDSGWYSGAVNEVDDTDELEAFYAYQLLKIRPELIKVLALPFEYMVIFNNDEIKAVLDAEDNDIWLSTK